jgi:hypothetical protein
VDVRPVVLLAAKALGPGSIRLEMVKLVHELNERRSELTAFEGRSEIHLYPPAARGLCEFHRAQAGSLFDGTPDGGTRF